MSIGETRLFELLQCCHSILNTAWPKPGVEAMAGARIFIGTKLFEALKNSAKQISTEITQIDDPEDRSLLTGFWNVCNESIQHLEVNREILRDDAVDRIFNLLYLASGVAYHYVIKRTRETPDQNERFSTMEELQVLLVSCAWKSSSGNQDVQRIMMDVQEEMITFMQQDEYKSVSAHNKAT